MSKTSYITVHNNSTVDLYYKWVIKYPKQNKTRPKIKRMDSDMINIGDVAEYLPGNSTTKFPVTLLSKNNKLGYFGLILVWEQTKLWVFNVGFSFYVIDIPESALAEDVRFWVTEESRSTSSLEIVNVEKVRTIICASVAHANGYGF